MINVGEKTPKGQEVHRLNEEETIQEEVCQLNIQLEKATNEIVSLKEMLSEAKRKLLN